MNNSDLKTIKEKILLDITEIREDIKILNGYVDYIESEVTEIENLNELEIFLYTTEEPKLKHIELF